MTSNHKPKVARRCERMEVSAIRELLKVLGKPGMISLSGGAPAAESFPLDTIRVLAEQILVREGANVLQYGATEGYPPLREALSSLLAVKGIRAEIERIGITTGAQTAIDAAAKILIDPGDAIAVEAPSFLAALKTFHSYEAKFVEVETDDDGIVVESLRRAAEQNNLKFLYLIPNFQNPSGRTLSATRRHEIAHLVEQYDLTVIEDDPYFELRYSGEHIFSLWSLIPEHVIYIGSLSKIFAPGMRLGYYVAPPSLQDLLTSCRQGVEVHSNMLAQAIAADFIKEGYLESHLPKVQNLYRERLSALLAGLAKNLPAGFSYSQPEGGMYVWVEGPAGFDNKAAYDASLKRNVAFVPGQHFFADSRRGRNAFRLNFTNATPDKLSEATRVIGEVLA